LSFRTNRSGERLLQRLRGVTVALIAEKVETQEQYLKARDEGFTLMQGYYFCRPVLLETIRFLPTGCSTLRSCACCRTKPWTCTSWRGW
jgi:c-di-GMP-related signal transduction protein